MGDINYWINTKDYSTAQLLWNGIGCLFWVITYAALVREIVRKKFVEMPFFIAIGNIAWEFVWGFFYHPDTGKLFALSYQGAFFLDVFIFYFVLKYGYKQIHIPEIQKHFKWISFGLLAMWLPLNYFFVKQGFDTSIGANSGYILNVIISLLYPLLLLRSDVKYFSETVAWCKFIGTGCISVSMFLIYPHNYLVHTLAISCFVLDLLYAILLKRKLIHATS
ncbi:MAG: hypothetical protein JNM51_00600 [Bacteroidia bacterium]|nr:hypothetical protein [Bacteroidia bacterium]